MFEIKSREFCEIVDSKVNTKIKHPDYVNPFQCWQTEEGVCFLPLYDVVEVYKNETELVEYNRYAE